MSAHLLPCRCGSDITVTAAQAGGRARCDACGAEMEVPTFRELSRLKKAEAAPKPAAAGARSWSAFHSMFLAGTLLAAACGLGSVAFVPPEIEMFDAATVRESVVRAPTDEVLTVLRTRLAASGIERPFTVQEAKSSARADFYYSLRDGLRIAAAIGGLVALAGAAGVVLGRGRGTPATERRE